MPPNIPKRIQWRDIRLYTRYNEFEKGKKEEEIQQVKVWVEQKINEQETPKRKKRRAEHAPSMGGKKQRQAGSSGEAGSSGDREKAKSKLKFP